MTTMQIILGGSLIAAALLMAGRAGWWLWRWTGRVADKMKRKAVRPVQGLAQRLADGRAVR